MEEQLKLPSAHQINDIVNIDFENSKFIKDCKVVGVTFTRSKVFYGIELPVGFEHETTILHGVDSILITK